MAPPAPPVYTIADPQVLGRTGLPEAVAAMATAGVRWIQIRAKTLGAGELYRSVAESLRLLRGLDVALWIDDRVDVAALLPVAGVHLGQRDLPAGAARAVLGRGTWIGCSTHDRAELRAADEDPAVDVIAVGPVFPTRGKRVAEPVVGLEFVAEARRLTSKPLVAIGGITAARVPSVLAAGADCVAALGAACRAPVEESCRRLVAASRARERRRDASR